MNLLLKFDVDGADVVGFLLSEIYLNVKTTMKNQTIKSKIFIHIIRLEYEHGG